MQEIFSTPKKMGRPKKAPISGPVSLMRFFDAQAINLRKKGHDLAAALETYPSAMQTKILAGINRHLQSCQKEQITPDVDTIAEIFANPDELDYVSAPAIAPHNDYPRAA